MIIGLLKTDLTGKSGTQSNGVWEGLASKMENRDEDNVQGTLVESRS